MVIFVNCLRFSLRLLSRISEKVRKYVFYMEKKTNKPKSEIFKFLRKSVLSFDKIEGNYVLNANSIKNMLIRVFLHVEFI